MSILHLFICQSTKGFRFTLRYVPCVWRYFLKTFSDEYYLKFLLRPFPVSITHEPKAKPIVPSSCVSVYIRMYKICNDHWPQRNLRVLFLCSFESEKIVRNRKEGPNASQCVQTKLDAMQRPRHNHHIMQTLSKNWFDYIDLPHTRTTNECNQSDSRLMAFIKNSVGKQP